MVASDMRSLECLVFVSLFVRRELPKGPLDHPLPRSSGQAVSASRSLLGLNGRDLGGWESPHRPSSPSCGRHQAWVRLVCGETHCLLKFLGQDKHTDSKTCLNPRASAPGPNIFFDCWGHIQFRVASQCMFHSTSGSSTQLKVMHLWAKPRF